MIRKGRARGDSLRRPGKAAQTDQAPFPVIPTSQLSSNEPEKMAQYLWLGRAPWPHREARVTGMSESPGCPSRISYPDAGMQSGTNIHTRLCVFVVSCRVCV